MLEEGPHGRRPNKALIMAHLRRAGIEFNPLESGSALYAKLKEAEEEESAPEPKTRRKATRRGNSK